MLELMMISVRIGSNVMAAPVKNRAYNGPIDEMPIAGWEVDNVDDNDNDDDNDDGRADEMDGFVSGHRPNEPGQLIPNQSHRVSSSRPVTSESEDRVLQLYHHQIHDAQKILQEEDQRLKQEYGRVLELVDRYGRVSTDLRKIENDLLEMESQGRTASEPEVRRKMEAYLELGRDEQVARTAFEISRREFQVKLARFLERIKYLDLDERSWRLMSRQLSQLTI